MNEEEILLLDNIEYYNYFSKVAVLIPGDEVSVLFSHRRGRQKMCH